MRGVLTYFKLAPLQMAFGATWRRVQEQIQIVLTTYYVLSEYVLLGEEYLIVLSFCLLSIVLPEGGSFA